MSSGAYAVEVPVALIAGAVMSVVEGVERMREIREERDREIAALDSVRRRVDQFVQEMTGEMGDVAQMLSAALSAEDHHVDATEVSHFQGITTLYHSTMVSGFNEDELVFSEVDAQSGKIIYVAIDFSSVLSVANARNSTEYQKMKLASAYTKKLMTLSAPSMQKQDVNNFITLMNQLMDDKSVTLETFENILKERFTYLQRSCETTQALDEALWAAYCAVCAMRHEQPRHFSSNAALEQAITQAMSEEVTSRYRAGAGAALRETMEELGLQVGADVELERLQGQLFTEPGNDDYAIFVNMSEHGFVLEMTESDTPSEQAKAHKTSLCAKRRMLIERMREKGYVISVTAETDHVGVSREKVALPKAQDKKETAADRMRKRRMIAGKKGKSRAIGGAV